MGGLSGGADFKGKYCVHSRMSMSSSSGIFIDRTWHGTSMFCFSIQGQSIS